jgi:hypothetical protein
MQPDSLRAVLDSVFAAPDYLWVERTPPLAFLGVAGSRDWRGGSRTAEAHPLGFRLLLGALVTSWS